MLFKFTTTLLMAAVAQAHDTVLSVHGSGTTNPSQCYWNVMDEFMTRTKQPVRMTYRAVGSSTGRVEFIEQPNPAADFGSGDIPLTTEQWQGLSDAGITALHLPVLVGAVGLFHSVPTLNDAPLNMTACLLARIYTGDLLDWGDADVKELNPNMELQSNGKLPIKIARRVLGSSSTSDFTEYLSKSCSGVFPSSLSSSLPEWPSDTQVLPGCQGSGGMSQCIRDNVGAIGYIDSGHGIKDGLPEVRLPRSSNQEDTDTFWNSAEAQAAGGVAQAEVDILPADATANFGDVSLIDRPNAWPMVLLTYVYVRQDLSHMPEPDERGLLVAFLKALYDPDFVSICRDEYGFILPSENMRSFGLNAIATLEQQANVSVTPWTVESETEAITGQGDYVISVKRESVKDLERDRLTDAVTTLDGSIDELEKASALTLQTIEDLESDIRDAEAQIASLLQSVNAMQELLLKEGVSESALRSGLGDSDFGDTEETQLKASLALSSISFIGVIVLLVMSFMGRGKAASSTSYA